MRRKGPESPLWRGGRWVSGTGHVSMRAPEHPRATSFGRVHEHVLVAERALGRVLPDGVEIHHVNEDPSDNRSCNLVICQDHAYHMLLHKRMRALAACGDANARPCRFCHKYDRQDDIRVYQNGNIVQHRSCAAEYARRQRAQRQTEVA